MKKLIAILLTLAVFWGVGYLVATNVEATLGGPWTNHQWKPKGHTEWTACEPIAECGTDEGTQSRDIIYECKFELFGNVDCDLGDTKVVETQYQSCKVETPACPVFYSACHEDACVLVEGEGEDQCEVDKDCQEPEPTPTPEPEPIPEPEPGNPVEMWKSADYHAPSCDNIGDTPKAPIVTQGYRLDSDTVNFTWIPSTDPVDFQIIKYGVTPDNLNMGIPELPADSHEIPVDFLYGMNWWYQVGASYHNCVAWSELIMN